MTPETLLPTALISAALALLTVIAAVRVIRERWRHKVALGDGNGAQSLLVANRAFGNLTEYAPLFVVTLLVAQLRGASYGACLAVGLLFLLARLVHFASFSAKPNIGRMIGMAGTFSSFILVALLAVW